LLIDFFRRERFGRERRGVAGSKTARFVLVELRILIRQTTRRVVLNI
jgi:hypothetical protein